VPGIENSPVKGSDDANTIGSPAAVVSADAPVVVVVAAVVPDESAVVVVVAAPSPPHAAISNASAVRIEARNLQVDLMARVDLITLLSSSAQDQHPR
jgi:hypothetical protein